MPVEVGRVTRGNVSPRKQPILETYIVIFMVFHVHKISVPSVRVLQFHYNPTAYPTGLDLQIFTRIRSPNGFLANVKFNRRFCSDRQNFPQVHRLAVVAHLSRSLFYFVTKIRGYLRKRRDTTNARVGDSTVKLFVQFLRPQRGNISTCISRLLPSSRRSFIPPPSSLSLVFVFLFPAVFVRLCQR